MGTYHLCILDNEPASIVTPAFDSYIPTDGLVLSYGKTQEATAKRIQKIVKSRSMQCEIHLQPDVTEVAGLKDHYSELLERYIDEHDVWLNASTGSHHHMLSAFDVFRTYQQQIFIVEPKLDRLHWLYPDNLSATEIADKINLSDFLSLYGAKLATTKNKAGISADIRVIGEHWAMHADSYADALGRLNYLAFTADNSTLTSVPLSDKFIRDPNLNQLITDLEELDYVGIKNNKLVFASEEARFFANGGWLEELVFSIVRGLRSKLGTIHDDGHSIEISRDIGMPHPVKNELDVALLANNKLHLIECKTKKFESNGASSALYKLDSLTDLLGGIQARGMLVSYLPISKSDKRRAKALGIKVVSAKQLQNLKAIIKQWVLLA
ncbi:DUF1887 family protein [Neiella sp. HB171785]|uniref:DUF1887 family protein n=1 Tax=Neiella litorisoli TaxID=2771431 RepID=A0A8J6QIF1_9GAMM|nr:DUF1887 family CARF protein [Neiella litorisoli]MBD1389273.1 DUF1887 family protein [Neiella litorisoli]